MGIVDRLLSVRDRLTMRKQVVNPLAGVTNEVRDLVRAVSTTTTDVLGFDKPVSPDSRISSSKAIHDQKVSIGSIEQPLERRLRRVDL